MQVYDAVDASGKKGSGLAGVMFWRWAVVDTGADLGDFDRGSLITSDSPVFTDVIEPYAAAVAARNARGAAVKGCKKDARKPADAAKPAADAAKPVATASVPAARRLAGWADTSDIDVSQLAVQLPGGYRPAGLSGPWAGATSSQMKMTWNPEFVSTPTPVEEVPAPAPAPVKKDVPKKEAPKKAPAPAPAAAVTPAANKTAAPPAAAAAANKTVPKPTPAATPVAAVPLDGVRSSEPRLASSAKVDMDAINRRITCAA